MLWCFVLFNKKERNELQSPDLNQKICEPTPKFWSKLNDLWTRSRCSI